MQAKFSINCRKCQRLVKFLDEVKVSYPDYHARPVPAFGDAAPKLLIIGLAPGMHGANRTGRPFTGDFAGILLYKTLYKYGFSNYAESVSATDSLRLIGTAMRTGRGSLCMTRSSSSRGRMALTVGRSSRPVWKA